MQQAANSEKDSIIAIHNFQPDTPCEKVVLTELNNFLSHDQKYAEGKNNYGVPYSKLYNENSISKKSIFDCGSHQQSNLGYFGVNPSTSNYDGTDYVFERLYCYGETGIVCFELANNGSEKRLFNLENISETPQEYQNSEIGSNLNLYIY